MKPFALATAVSALLVSLALAAPIIDPDVEARGSEGLRKRDGWREFDTDLCVLKKRAADVLGQGIDNCDM
ncbi:hypothetical protein QBC42DRAFT_288184 [Cladorrhinum samala]|uniref:Uncharacterized protein n=1 Tax=Cladorrhinum samala TaxID=585594 RepID=A0AAV9HLM9_9PEZI|nr:hypothetical protein QBC42DRAFT_288184 [Cladorrhinum samala]